MGTSNESKEQLLRLKEKAEKLGTVTISLAEDGYIEKIINDVKGEPVSVCITEDELFMSSFTLMD